MRIAGNGGFDTRPQQQEEKKSGLLEFFEKIREFNESVHQWNLRLGNPTAQQEEHKRRKIRR